jgi:hypothetical protein
MESLAEVVRNVVVAYENQHYYDGSGMYRHTDANEITLGDVVTDKAIGRITEAVVKHLREKWFPAE